MNKKILTLLLIAIALGGTTSYATTEQSPAEPPAPLAAKPSESELEKWDPDTIADPRDPGLTMTPQGASTYALIDPSCGSCVEAMKIQLRMHDATRAPQRPNDSDAGSPANNNRGRR